MTVAKILLIVLGFGSYQVVVPLAQQFDTAKACADAAASIDFTPFTHIAVVCVDTSTGQVAYLRSTR